MLQQLYSWADAFIVGKVEGETALAAIGATEIAALITRIAGSYLMKPMFGNMVIVYAEVVSWGMLLLLYVLRALWRRDGRRAENCAASGV